MEQSFTASVSLHLDVYMGTGKFNAGMYPSDGLASHPEGVVLSAKETGISFHGI